MSDLVSKLEKKRLKLSLSSLIWLLNREADLRYGSRLRLDSTRETHLTVYKAIVLTLMGLLADCWPTHSYQRPNRLMICHFDANTDRLSHLKRRPNIEPKFTTIIKIQCIYSQFSDSDTCSAVQSL